MTINSLRFRRGLTVATSFLLTVGTASFAHAAPPEDGDEGGGEDVETDEWGAIESTDEDAPPEDAEESPPAESPPDGADEDDWGDDEDDWGDDEDDDWDGQVLIEDVSDDPEAAEAEKVEQVEVEGVSGTVTGVVKDTTTGEGLLGANVRALKTPYEVTTDAEGKYTLNLPPGTYTLEFFYETFSVKEVANIVVEADGSTSQNVELTPMAGMTTETVIEAEAPKGDASVVNVQRKEADTTQDVMSAEEMKKSGGGNVGNVARLIVGATLEDNRYLIVRGLSHRYGNTLFDGARLPSPDPNLRTVPLDIFPSGALSQINIVKTFSPDNPADYVGASTKLVSREIPDDFTLDLSVSLEANTNATFQQIYRDKRVLGDGLAFGNLKRGFPKGFPTNTPVGGQIVVDGQQVERHSNEELELFGEALFMETGLNPATAPPNYSLGATLGDRVYLGNGTKFGWVTAAKLKDGYDANIGGVGNYNCVSSDPGVEPPEGSFCPDDFVYVVRTDYGIGEAGGRSDTYSRNTQLAGIGLFKFDIRDAHKVYGNVFYSRDGDSSVRYQEGRAPSSIGDPDLRSTRHRYTMRSVLFTQLGAEHEFERAKGLTMDYFGSYSQARFDDPGVRDVLYVQRPNGRYQVDPSISVPRLQTLGLVDDVENGAVNFTMPFKQWKQLGSKFKFGAWAEGKQREFRSRRFNYRVASGLESQVPFGVQDIIRPETVGGGVGAGSGGVEPFSLQETTNETDNYFGNQKIFAGYAMMSLPFVRWFELIGGTRYEFSEIDVGTFDAFDADADVDEPANLVDSDFFPSVALVFKPTEKMNVRLVGSQTIARPEMRELAPFAFIDFAGGTQVQGNPNLVSTKVWNADLRYEFFPTGEEVVAVSGFFKYFDAPIERGLSAGGSNFSATFVNTDKAYNVGGEFEVKKNLGFLGRRSKKNGGGTKKNTRWLEDLSVGANFAYIWSRVEIQPAVNRETGEVLGPEDPPSACAEGDERCQLQKQYGAASSSARPLQGQSPWIANGFVDYDNESTGTNVRMIYNAFGRRIRSIGGLGQSDEYQLPVHTLDLAFSQRLFRVADNTDEFLASTSNELRLTAKVGNILNWRVEWGQFDGQGEFYTTEFFRQGVDISLGLSYSF